MQVVEEFGFEFEGHRLHMLSVNASLSGISRGEE